MSSFGSFLGIYNDSYDLIVKSSQAMIALSAVALIGGVVQAYRYKKSSPYVLVCFAALCYLIQGAINGSIDSQVGRFIDMVPPALSAYFFGALFPILVWVLLLDIFRLAHPKSEGTTTWKLLKTELVCTFSGYIWAFIMFICDIAVVGSLGSLVNGSAGLSLSLAFNALRTLEFVTYGLWAFIPLYIYQQRASWNITRPFFRSFAVFAALVFCVTIGRTANLATSMNNIDGSQAVAAQAVDFVFARILGIFGLYWVIAFGHTWVNNDSTPKADVEQQQDASPAPQAAADNTKTEVSEHN
ncbi:hypothetical protein LRAMOSA01450 [Lichtheimia ramosa]|uniref:Uncharacterized protein n=1 Tax=Lichtheimia ramosa TaxID=688394 RepID=A0A077WIF1_9FUNG|nr:hypothetical protein LRAMOSA01450 [Lichtheimia ramosa]